MPVSTSLSMLFNTAQSIEVNRSQLVAQSMSRNGKLLLASRNWVNPWRFVVRPRPVWDWSDYRGSIETLMQADRFSQQTLQIGTDAFSNTASNWMWQYQGDFLSYQISAGVTAQVSDGNELTIRFYGDGTTPESAYYIIDNAGPDFKIFGLGDIIQATGNPYPHMITSDIYKAWSNRTRVEDQYWEYTVPLHRGWLGTTASGQNLLVGSQCTFNLVATKLPVYRFIPPKRVEFTGEFEFTEVVE